MSAVADTVITTDQPLDAATPVKSEAPATDAAADASHASAAATPARLNANAKSFVPVKLDEVAVDTASATGTTGAAGTSATPSAGAGPKKADRSPKAGVAGVSKKTPPYNANATKTVNPLPPPGGFLMPGLMNAPFMGMGVPPFMPSPMMMNNPMMMGMLPQHHQMGGMHHPNMPMHPGVNVGMPNGMGIPPPMMMNPMGLNMMGMPPTMHVGQPHNGHLQMPMGMMPPHMMVPPSPAHGAPMNAHPTLSIGVLKQGTAAAVSANPTAGAPTTGTAAANATANNTATTTSTSANNAAANSANNAAASNPMTSMISLVPASPLVATTGFNASMNVSVGNASLAALRSNAPARIACVLLVGLPQSGKTTIGRQLVSELSEDKMGWSFFSGSDYLKESATKKAPWETTRDVFDGLGTYIDGILSNNATNPTRGLVIDKNVKGIEDIFYLAALLKSKNLQLNGIVSFDSTNDETLLQRLGGEDGKERLKFYRVILNRIQEGTRGTNLFHIIDSSKPLVESLKALRTQVLGCSAIQAVRPLNTNTYGDSNCQLVEDYAEYFRIMTAISTYAKTPKANQFPGLVNYIPMSNKSLDDRKFRAALVEGSTLAVRRKVDGTKFILYHDNQQLYLIPRHQRAILRVPLEAWVGFSLSNCGPFILDGELVRTGKDASREKFLVYDVIFWAEKGSTQNNCRGAWKERQDRLRAYLANESDGFFQVKTNMVIVHQKIVTSRDIGQLFDTADYPVEGLAFHPTTRREDAVILWRPPRQITADFRVGATKNVVAPTIVSPTSPKDNVTVYTYELEVFDAKSIPARYSPYLRYGGVDVSVNGRQTAPTQGAIITCQLNFEGEGHTGARSWKYLCVRPDLAISMFKNATDELLDECIVPKERLTKVLIDEKLMVDPVAKAAAEAAAAAAATAQVARTGFGTHMIGTDPAAASLSTSNILPAQRSMRDILIGTNTKPLEVKLGGITIGSPMTVKVGGTTLLSSPPRKFDDHTTVTVGSPPTAGASISGVIPNVPSVTVGVSLGSTAATNATDNKDGNKRRSTDASAATDALKEGEPRRRCVDCKREKNEADGRVDKSQRNRPFYCFGCWAKVGSEFCQQCSEFAKGHRGDAKGNSKGGLFYCEPCWLKYEERKGRKGSSDKKDEKDATEKIGKEAENNRRQKKSKDEKVAVADKTTSEKKEESKKGDRKEASSRREREPRKDKKSAADAIKDDTTTTTDKKEDSAVAKTEKKERQPRERKERDENKKKEKAVDTNKDAAAAKTDDGSASEDGLDSSQKKSRRGRRGGRGRKGGKDGEGENSASASGEVPPHAPAPAPKAAPVVVVASA